MAEIIDTQRGIEMETIGKIVETEKRKRKINKMIKIK